MLRLSPGIIGRIDGREIRRNRKAVDDSTKVNGTFLSLVILSIIGSLFRCLFFVDLLYFSKFSDVPSWSSSSFSFVLKQIVDLRWLLRAVHLVLVESALLDRYVRRLMWRWWNAPGFPEGVLNGALVCVIAKVACSEVMHFISNSFVGASTSGLLSAKRQAAWHGQRNQDRYCTALLACVCYLLCLK